MKLTKSSLAPGQCRLVEVINALGFGSIEGLLIRDGMPCYEQEPRIVQSVKLAPGPDRQPDRSGADLTLKKEFENLFDELTRLRDGLVDIEVRHSIPTRLVLERSYKELP